MFSVGPWKSIDGNDLTALSMKSLSIIGLTVLLASAASAQGDDCSSPTILTNDPNYGFAQMDFDTSSLTTSGFTGGVDVHLALFRSGMLSFSGRLRTGAPMNSIRVSQASTRS